MNEILKTLLIQLIVAIIVVQYITGLPAIILYSIILLPTYYEALIIINCII